MTTHAGQDPLRREDARLLRGRASFVDNIDLARMAHGAFVRSPFAHAEIGAIGGHGLAQPFHVQGATVTVDVAAVRRAAQRHDSGAHPAK